jgi:hypothetical protein
MEKEMTSMDRTAEVGRFDLSLKLMWAEVVSEQLNDEFVVYRMKSAVAAELAGIYKGGSR